jgi:hypothetical protein
VRCVVNAFTNETMFPILADRNKGYGVVDPITTLP